MRYTDPKLRAYYLTLPSKVRARLMNTKVEFGSLGELMMVGEHFRSELPPEEQHPPAPPPD